MKQRMHVKWIDSVCSVPHIRMEHSVSVTSTKATNVNQ
jgi:hypothetical protein